MSKMLVLLRGLPGSGKSYLGHYIWSEGHYYPEIVVCNTFSQEWEMKDYFDLASTYGYRVVSLIVENRHGSKNVHNVPEETLEKMRNRFEVKL